MVQRINSRRDLFISHWRSPWAWFSGLIFLLGLYFYPQWPALGQFMPLWAYTILGLGLLWVATFETAYRYIRSIQPPSIAEIRKLLLRRQTEGFSIRKRRGDGWEAKALAWYQTVLDDLTLIFGPNYSLLFDAELGRKPNIKLPTGGKNPDFLIVPACEMLENRMKQDLVEGHITPSVHIANSPCRPVSVLHQLENLAPTQCTNSHVVVIRSKPRKR